MKMTTKRSYRAALGSGAIALALMGVSAGVTAGVASAGPPPCLPGAPCGPGGPGGPGPGPGGPGPGPGPAPAPGPPGPGPGRVCVPLLPC